MKNRGTKLLAMCLIAAGAAGLVLAADASAQVNPGTRKAVEKLEPPTPGQAKTDGIVLPMLMGIVLAGATLTVNLIPSKRGHQD